MSVNAALLTFKEAMRRLKVSRSTLYRLMGAGKLRGYKVGATWRFRAEEVDELPRQVDMRKGDARGTILTQEEGAARADAALRALYTAGLPQTTGNGTHDASGPAALPRDVLADGQPRGGTQRAAVVTTHIYKTPDEMTILLLGQYLKPCSHCQRPLGEVIAEQHNRLDLMWSWSIHEASASAWYAERRTMLGDHRWLHRIGPLGEERLAEINRLLQPDDRGVVPFYF